MNKKNRTADVVVASQNGALIPIERIERRIYLIRGQKVMLSGDLAELYGVPQGRLNEAVRRNTARFPADFMFRLSWEEARISRSQNAILKQGLNIKYTPYAFTEQGVAMLSSALRSPTAIAVNIQIMRAFVRLRQYLASHDELRRKLDRLEKRLGQHDRQIAAVFDAIRQLMAERDEPPDPPEAAHRLQHRAFRPALFAHAGQIGHR